MVTPPKEEDDDEGDVGNQPRAGLYGIAEACHTSVTVGSSVLLGVVATHTYPRNRGGRGNASRRERMGPAVSSSRSLVRQARGPHIRKCQAGKSGPCLKRDMCTQDFRR
ncbi:hypothetical protein BHM03_00050913 [Ensete ventricosum]|nr:hypothetical protein BHM03_00050913 [Ensete ventricosum]